MPPPSQRLRRVQNLLRAEISTVLHRKLKDPRVGMVTIVAVKADADLHRARIYVSVHGGSEDRAAALAGLRSGAGFIRAELMKVLHLRPMPTLEFQADDSLARGARTLDLLDQIRHEQEDSDGPSRTGGSSDREH
jgi:ribosome-binding factor A